MFKRGGIYDVDLAVEGERESCPALVVSNNISNEYSSVVTIIPLSFGGLDKIYDFESSFREGRPASPGTRRSVPTSSSPSTRRGFSANGSDS